MAIKIVLGAPGRGKSTFLAYISKKALKEGKNVYSNTYIKGTKMLDPRLDLNYYSLENGVVIIDEAGTVFDNRDWKNFGERCTRFFKMHRHYNLDVYLASQFLDIDSKIRNVTDEILVCKKALLFPWIGKVKKVSADIEISEDGRDICMIYKWRFFPKLFLAWRCWGLFNSYWRDILNSKDWVEWCEENEKVIQKDFTNIPIKESKFISKKFN